jgi:thioredoxin-dependent peroxiredoxin
MARPQKGDNAPNFEGVNEKGERVSLGDYKGSKLILFFYPKDDTPGCTAAACSLRDDYDTLQKHGFKMLGVSPDKPAKHQKFIDKYGFPFSLLSDENKEVLKAYGAWGRKKFMGREYDGVLRSTFIIDEEGKIMEVIDKVKTKTHAAQIMEILGLD